MLKRQRPVSPQPSIPIVPLIDNPSLDMITDRDSKRRRILPPALDGPSRGWGSNPSYRGPESEDSAEEDVGDVDENFSCATSIITNEYKSANNVLRELHTLQQHRLLSASPSSVPFPLFLSTSELPSSVTSSCSRYGTSINFKGCPSPNPEHTRMQYNKEFHIAVNGPELVSRDGMDTEEDRVTERYENTNKLLGSLFLARRRELGSYEHNHNS